METKQSMECILKDPMGKTIPVVPRLISVNPLNIIIEPSTGQIDKSLELKNVYPCRVAFRIRTNGPTRYTVCPNKGFLSIGEKTMILISMIEGSKYQSNHQFIVQAMAAPGDFSDRKLIWKQPNPLGFLTNTRVKTMRPGQSLNSPCSKSPMVLSTPNDSSISSPARSESLATGSASSLTKPADNGVFADNINNLSSQVKKAIAEKNARASEMVAVVNQIKAIEVELDRQAQVVNELSERVKKGELQYSNLVMLERNLRTELDRYKNNDGGELSGLVIHDQMPVVFKRTQHKFNENNAQKRAQSPEPPPEPTLTKYPQIKTKLITIPGQALVLDLRLHQLDVLLAALMKTT